jgi:histidinol-phosphate aminotransferase
MSRDERAHGVRPHGGLRPEELAELGLRPDEILDFSVNVNPFGPSPAVLAAARAAPLDRYPDPTAFELRTAIARRHGVPADEVVVGNGAADLLWTLARVLLGPGRTALVVEPTFSELGAAAHAAGARVVVWRASSRDDFGVDLRAVARLASSTSARLVYLCSPGSPTGSRVPLPEICELAAGLPDAVIVLDQAFVTLSEHPEEATSPVPRNVVRVRSMTKDHAIAGVRLGFALAPGPLARALEAGRAGWTTSTVAQAAGLAALEDEEFTARCRARLIELRRALADALRALGLRPVPSTTGFLAAPVGDARALRARLLQRRILVRDCTSFGLADHIRLAARPPGDLEHLLAALRDELG